MVCYILIDTGKGYVLPLHSQTRKGKELTLETAKDHDACILATRRKDAWYGTTDHAEEMAHVLLHGCTAAEAGHNAFAYSIGPHRYKIKISILDDFSGATLETILGMAHKLTNESDQPGRHNT